MSKEYENILEELTKSIPDYEERALELDAVDLDTTLLIALKRLELLDPKFKRNVALFCTILVRFSAQSITTEIQASLDKIEQDLLKIEEDNTYPDPNFWENV